jgi:hypothetical protein
MSRRGVSVPALLGGRSDGCQCALLREALPKPVTSEEPRVLFAKATMNRST